MLGFRRKRRAAGEDRGGAQPELRASPENPSTPLSNPAAWLIEWMTGGTQTTAGVQISPENALEVAAVWACINGISNTIATLPLKVYRQTGDDSRGEATDSPMYRLLHDAPVPLGVERADGRGLVPVTSYNWRRQIMLRTLRRGRHLTQIVRDRRDRVRALAPLHALTITAETEAGRLRYAVQLDGERKTTRYAPDEVLDFVCLADEDGLGVHAPVAKCRNAIGLARALEEYGARFFANDARPGVVAEIPGRLRDTTAAQLKEDLESKHRGLGKSHRLMVLEEGVKLHTVGVEPEQAQFLESRRFQLEEIARAFDMPPSMIQDLTRGTFSNTEQQDLHYTKHTIRPWLVMMEQELRLKLLGDSPELLIEFQVDGLLRGDFKTRMEGYAKAIQNAVMTPNEARARENLPRMAGGDDLVLQQNMTPTENLGADGAASGSDADADAE